MSRTSAFLVVLALAAGPDAAIVCQALCAPTADQACDHDEPDLAQIVAGISCCDDLAAGAAPSQLPVMRRDTSVPNGHIAIPVLLDTLVRAQTAEHLGYEPGRRQSLAHRPLPTVLRI